MLTGSESSHAPRAAVVRARRHLPRSLAFTLVELLHVGTIAIMIGLVFPLLQHHRQAWNTARATTDVVNLVRAEAEYESNNDGALAGLQQLAALGLIDQTLGTGQDHGYLFWIVPDSTVFGRFVAHAVPAAPGRSGRIDLSSWAVSSGQVDTSTSSDRGSEEGQAAAISEIDVDGGNAIGRIVRLAPFSVEEEIADYFQSGKPQHRKQIKRVFDELDLNGDGKVTIGEIVSYGQGAPAAVASFVDDASHTLQLGIANEDLAGVPGVSLADILDGRRITATDTMSIGIANGTSTLLPDPNNGLPAVQLVATCSGSIRTMPFESAQFTSILPFTETPGTLAGTFAVQRGDGLGVHGILVGLYPPDPASPATLKQGFFLVTGGTGPLASGFGSGPAAVQWGDGTVNGPFSAGLTASLSFARSP